MLIEFSKIWGQDDFRWNYCGGDWNFRTMAGFMEFYGIKEAWIVGKYRYYETDAESDEDYKECNVYAGWVTKEIEQLKKHWTVEYCKPCVLTPLKIMPWAAL